jgi:hypothetical protein
MADDLKLPSGRPKNPILTQEPELRVSPSSGGDEGATIDRDYGGCAQ